MDQEQWTRVRTKVLRDGLSKRSVADEEKINFRTLQRMLDHPVPPGYCRNKPLPEKKITPFYGWIQDVVSKDKELPRKQRHSITRIFDRLREEKGFTGSYTIVREAVNEISKRTQEVYVPLIHHPGEAQVDFGHALVNVAGELGKYDFFVLSLPYSDAFYVQVFPRECTETFQEGHRRAFNYFGKVPTRISYDNSGIAVSRVLGGRKRKLTEGFLQLQSHYLFEEHFCRVARGNEKGVVEGIVKYARSHFMVPVPQVESLSELNEKLEAHCRRDLQRKLRGKSQAKEQLLLEDLAAMRDLPSSDFNACRRVSTTSNSLSLVRFQSNDYSVPVQYAHRTVLVKGYTEQVEIYVLDKLIATHRRLWGKEDVMFEPIHYLALLEKKPGAIDYAKPLEDWDLPECFGILRRRLEDELDSEGTREYIKVLRLLEKHSIGKLRQAVVSSLRHNGLTCDAIAQYLYPQGDYGSTLFSLDRHPHLRHVQVKSPDISDYSSLLGQEVHS